MLYIVGGGSGGAGELYNVSKIELPVISNGQTVFPIASTFEGVPIVFLYGVSQKLESDYTVAGGVLNWISSIYLEVGESLEVFFLRKVS